jgi:tetratricopeptide (TPR) repeat protein
MDFQHAYDLHICAIKNPDKHYLLHQAKDAYMSLELTEPVLTNLISILLLLESYYAVQEIYDILIKHYPSQDAYLNYGDLCYKLKNFKKSEELYIEAIELGSKQALINYGWQLQGQSRFHNALFYYRVALQEPEPDNELRAKILFNIGLIYHERFMISGYHTHYHDAQTNYIQSIELMPHNNNASKLLNVTDSDDFWDLHNTLFN